MHGKRGVGNEFYIIHQDRLPRKSLPQRAILAKAGKI
jgi:hypothetical protein